MSKRGATWRGLHHQTAKQRANSRRHQRNRRMDDRLASNIPVGGMSYEELQYHVRRCRGKVAHKTRGAAYQAKLGSEREYGVECHVYECPICGKFHVTTHPWAGY